MDTYKEAKVIEFPGMVVKVFSPILTEEERNRRMKKIHDAAAKLLLHADQIKRGTENNG